MKKENLVLISILVVLLLVLSGGLVGQNKTIILVRHAEKADDPNKTGDPSLSEAGKDRAVRFRKRIGGLRPGAFYATEYKRTRETIEPIARKRGKTVEVYDSRQVKQFLAQVMASKIKRIVIAGHSNTIPMIANELTKKRLFRDLEESEFSTIWIIKIRDGKVKSVKLLDY